MFKSGFKASKEYIRTNLKSQGYKSKATKEAHDLTDIQNQRRIEWNEENLYYD